MSVQMRTPPTTEDPARGQHAEPPLAPDPPAPQAGASAPAIAADPAALRRRMGSRRRLSNLAFFAQQLYVLLSCGTSVALYFSENVSKRVSSPIIPFHLK